MLFNKSTLHQVLNRVAFFTLLNFTSNLVGLWFNKLITKENFLYPESIANEFVMPLIIQSIIFGLCIGAAYILLKNNKWSWLAFAAFQFLVLHIALFMGIHFKGGMHFETTINNPGLRYLSYNGQYLVDVLFTNKPLTGNFENGIFAPKSSLLFYFQWVVSIIIYYVVLSWLTVILSKFLSSNKTKKTAE